jgi:hypothetical protein
MAGFEPTIPGSEWPHNPRMRPRGHWDRQIRLYERQSQTEGEVSCHLIIRFNCECNCVYSMATVYTVRGVRQVPASDWFS